MNDVYQLSRRDYDAVIFDLDGVITDTAKTHFRAWKEVFDECLRRLEGEDYIPFSQLDYQRFVDGKPRHDGIRSFLSSRGVTLAEGPEKASPGYDSVGALGAEKNRRYQQRLVRGEIDILRDSLELVRQLRRAGFALGLVSSSRNAALVLELLAIDTYFDVRVDGITLAEDGMRGKPAPDMFVDAARRLGVPPKRAVVVEDAESGVEAGRAGGFGLVIGLAADDDQRQTLRDKGAHIAVDSLGVFEVI